MTFAQDKYNTELQQRIEKHAVTVRHMPDNELKTLYENIVDNSDAYDAALYVACYREVDRRSIAASWLWKRLINRNQYEDWKNFNERIEAKCMRQALDVIKKYKYDNPEKT